MKMALVLPFLSLAACVETTAPLCDASNKADVVGFDRQYVLSTSFDPSKDVESAQIKIERLGVGEYTAGGSDISTCRLGRFNVAEQKTKFGTYEQSIVSVDPAGATSLNQLLVDAKALAAGGVSYEIVERETGPKQKQWARSFGQLTNNKQKVMIINTDSPAARAVIEQNAKLSAFGISMY